MLDTQLPLLPRKKNPCDRRRVGLRSAGGSRTARFTRGRRHQRRTAGEASRRAKIVRLRQSPFTIWPLSARVRAGVKSGDSRAARRTSLAFLGQSECRKRSGRRTRGCVLVRGGVESSPPSFLRYFLF